MSDAQKARTNFLLLLTGVPLTLGSSMRRQDHPSSSQVRSGGSTK